MNKIIIAIWILAIGIFIYVRGQGNGYQKINPEEAKNKMEDFIENRKQETFIKGTLAFVFIKSE